MKEQPKFKKIIKSAVPPRLYSFITVGRISPGRGLNSSEVKLVEYVFNLN